MFVKSSVISPGDTLLALKIANLQAWFGRTADCQATFRRMAGEAERSPGDPFAAERAAKCWALWPSSDAAAREQALGYARKFAIQRTSGAHTPWNQQTLGLAEYRAGNFAAAEQALIASEQIAEAAHWNPRNTRFIVGPSRVVRAMILFRQGKVVEARELLAEAAAQMKPLPNDPREVLLTEADQNDVQVWVLFREAKGLLEPQAPAEPGRPDGK
jgi:cellobiose-specific phosphotransferase system component IIA